MSKQTSLKYLIQNFQTKVFGILPGHKNLWKDGYCISCAWLKKSKNNTVKLVADEDGWCCNVYTTGTVVILKR